LLTPSPPTPHPALDLSSVESLVGPAAAAAHLASKPQLHLKEEYSGARPFLGASCPAAPCM
jgi:hypothetical protein